MARRKFDFKEEDKIKVLLWCGRHCCWCGKFASVGIEVAHLDPKRSDIDNAIPLCFDCHAAVGHYNVKHPRGRKYAVPELKARRDQVYEEHTRHLVPMVDYAVFQGQNTPLPRVNFHIGNVGKYSAKARIWITLSKGGKNYGYPETEGHYNGVYLWNLNPGKGVNGHFKVPASVIDDPLQPLRARVDLTIIDIYEREHHLLPGGFVYGPNEEWYFEPAEEVFGPPTNNQ